jgi:hypothetical protein
VFAEEHNSYDELNAAEKKVNQLIAKLWTLIYIIFGL